MEYPKTPFTREKTELIQFGINFEILQMFSRDQSQSVLPLHGIDSGTLSLVPRFLYKDLNMRKDFTAFVFRVSGRRHYENASIAFFGVPHFASMPYWD